MADCVVRRRQRKDASKWIQAAHAVILAAAPGFFHGAGSWMLDLTCSACVSTCGRRLRCFGCVRHEKTDFRLIPRLQNLAFGLACHAITNLPHSPSGLA